MHILIKLIDFKIIATRGAVDASQQMGAKATSGRMGAEILKQLILKEYFETAQYVYSKTLPYLVDLAINI